MKKNSAGKKKKSQKKTGCKKKRSQKEARCANQTSLKGHGRRRVEVAFDGGDITSDGGLVLVREVLERMKLFDALAGCFTDYRDPKRIEHTVRDLLCQRVVGLIAGYEDLNDHERFRHDSLAALVVGKTNVKGASKRKNQSPLAGKSTLNRLELGGSNVAEGERYKKICYDEVAFQRLFIEHFLDVHAEPPESLTLDIDATDDRIHGEQEGRYYHGYYRGYVYMPLYIFAGDFLLSATLNTAERAPGNLALEDLERVIAQLRARWPEVKITIRGDSGFCRDEIMKMCEDNEGLHYILGLAQNKRLRSELAGPMELARNELKRTGEKARVFHDFTYSTRKSWSRTRRVVGKAEALVGRDNPRFVVTSLPADEVDAQTLYEELYCARGDMENRIKEQQLGLFADRTSTHTLRGNQLRLWISAIAYVVIHELRRLGLVGTELASAQVSTIRARLLKIGAMVKVSVRRISIAFSSAFPFEKLFNQVVTNLQTNLPLPES